jgi:predicted transcriptional regulator
MIQGTFNVRGVTVANLRDLEISQLPPLVTQDTIGRLYEDVLKRTKLDREIDYKKSEMILNFLKQINKGEK